MTFNKGLVGYWPLDNTPAQDITPYENSGTTNGSPSVVTGQVNNALDFNSSNPDYIDTGTSLLSTSDSSQPYTLMAWIKPSDLSSKFPIVSQYQQDSNDDGRFILRVSSTNSYLSYFKGGAGGIRGSTTIQTGEWIHVTATRNSNGDVKVYLNGNVDVSQDGFDTFTYSSAVTFQIGARNDAGQYADGLIDDVRVYRRVLSQSEIDQVRQVRNRRATTSDLYKGLIGKWNMESLSSKDRTPYGNDAREIGSASQVVTGQVGDAVDFDGGTGSYLACGDVDAGADTSTGVVSATAWVKEDGSPSHTDNSGQIGVISIRNEFNFTFVQDTNSDDRLYPTVGVYDGNIDSESQEPIARGDWSFVYWEYDNNTDTAKVVVDEGTEYTGSTGDSMASSSKELVLGGYHTSTDVPGNLDSAFDGAVDQIRLYNRALSSSERQRIMNQRAEQRQEL